ncbi:hypothetical protein EGW08_011171 [Elysia chlorotica]|uniref:Major facilitator superfamily (MFS) profile domain-containing protein n=1 Tax=Elysia chlorotica TaxID=188477 RepID=A0A433THM8_ELYCH|nr:hypothetical protein EGW08_011171 [Elysia chlorotica]
MEPSEKNILKQDLQEVLNSTTPGKAGKSTEEEPLPMSINNGDKQTNLTSNGHEQYGTFTGHVTFENVLHTIGHNGRFQLLLLLTVILTNAIVDVQNVHTVFTLTTPNHRCKVPGFDQDTYAITNPRQAELVDRYIPRSGREETKKCRLLPGLNETNSLHTETKEKTVGNLTACSVWVYDETVMKRNLVTELNLVCDRTVVRSHVNMVLFGGKMLAAFLQGYLMDLFGRRPSLILSCIGVMITGIGSAFVYDDASLLIARFLIGFLTTSLFLSIYVLGIEFLTKQQRSLLSIYSRVIFGVADLYMSLMAYLLKDWQYLLLAIAWPSIVAVFMCWIMPESPRWLMSKNKLEKAEEQLKRIAKINGKTLPKGMMQRLGNTAPPGDHTVLQLFGDLRLTMRWAILYINWIVSCMATYGLAFNISNMGGNIFINFAISGFLDATVSLFNSFIVNKLSRKYFFFGCSVFGSVACILTFLPIVLDAPNWCVVALSLIGKASIVSAYPLLYTYSAELYPTTHRGIGLGSCSMMARIGGLVSPYVADLSLFFTGKLASVLPQLVFGTSAIFGALLVLLLPETSGTELPETLEDIKGKPKKSTKPARNEDEEALV